MSQDAETVRNAPRSILLPVRSHRNLRYDTPVNNGKDQVRPETHRTGTDPRLPRSTQYEAPQPDLWRQGPRQPSSREQGPRQLQPTQPKARQHTEFDNEAISPPSSLSYNTVNRNVWRSNDDIRSLTNSLRSSRTGAKNSISAPTITIRSEFSNLVRSRQPQTLTCLVTVEVAEGMWMADMEDLRGSSSMRPIRTSQVESNYTYHPPRQRTRLRYNPQDSVKGMAKVANELDCRVDSWHGLDFARYY